MSLAGVVARTHSLAQRRGASMVDVLHELPDALLGDASRVAGAASAAFADGRVAAVRREGEVEAELARVRQGREST